MAKRVSLTKPPCLCSLNKSGLSESVLLSLRQFSFLSFCSCAKRVSLAKRNFFSVLELGLASLLVLSLCSVLALSESVLLSAISSLLENKA